MIKQDFVERVFKIAKAKGLRVDTCTQGDAKGMHRIWFNEKSKKFLRVDHVAQLHEILKEPALSVREIRATIEAVAPGRPCTHKGMREIYEKIHRAR
jgi:hypothetical protein